MDNEDKDEQSDDEQSDKGFEIATPAAKASVSRQTFAALLPYVGPHIKWLMFAGAVSLLTWALSEGFVKIWTAAKSQQQQLTD